MVILHYINGVEEKPSKQFSPMLEYKDSALGDHVVSVRALRTVYQQLYALKTTVGTENENLLKDAVSFGMGFLNRQSYIKDLSSDEVQAAESNGNIQTEAQLKTTEQVLRSKLEGIGAFSESELAKAIFLSFVGYDLYDPLWSLFYRRSASYGFDQSVLLRDDLSETQIQSIVSLAKEISARGRTRDARGISKFQNINFSELFENNGVDILSISTMALSDIAKYDLKREGPVVVIDDVWGPIAGGFKQVLTNPYNISAQATI